MPIQTTTTARPDDEAQQAAAIAARAAAASGVSVDTWRDLAYLGRTRKMPKGLDAWWDAGAGRIRHVLPRTGPLLRQAQQVCALTQDLQHVAAHELRERLEAMRVLYRRGRETRDAMAKTFALIREAAKRSLGMEPYPVQVASAIGLTQRRFIELATGEGKTLVAALPAVIAGWRGRGCHLITVNDYLAKRDADTLRPLYDFCNVRVSHIDEEMPPLERRVAYAADVTYCTNKSVTADYLRDRLSLGRLQGLTDALLAKRLRRMKSRRGTVSGSPDQMVMRGLDTAIVDEADSILIDEAVTPLIISSESDDAQRIESFSIAAELAAKLDINEDFRLNQQYREIDITRSGRRRLAELCAGMSGYWQGQRLREELVNQALSARHLFLLDQHYVVAEDKVVIVDESTGRLMPDRTWRAGLHQAVEAKEGVEVTAPKDTMARISFQRFFRGYKNLSAMSGTGWEARFELWQNYGLVTSRIPTHRPCIREILPQKVFANTEAKLAAVVEEVATLHDTGRPILIGTRSVESSEALSAMLTEKNLPHQVLNAVRHEEEAQVVAGAGMKGMITVATNMAGRGTDIKLGVGVTKLGGLHVISIERNDSPRIDRQLIGRAGRQGDPGSAVSYAALDDQLIKRYGRKALRKAAVGALPLRLSLLTQSQKRAHRMGKAQRRQVMKMDEQLAEQLGFAGREH